VAGLVLVSVIQQHSFQNSIAGSGPSGPSLSTGGHMAADAMLAIGLSSLAILLLLLSGWALVAGFAARVPQGRARRRWRLLAAAPLAAGLTEIALAALRDKFTPVVANSTTRIVDRHGFMTYTYRPGGHPLAALVVSTAYDVVAVAAAASILGVVLAARRADLGVSDLRGGVRLAQTTALVMIVVAVASVAWGIGVTHQPAIPPGALSGSVGSSEAWTGIQSSIAAQWPLISAVLMAISVVTTWAARSARQSYRAAQALLPAS
jgi:hypothetical protein